VLVKSLLPSYADAFQSPQCDEQRPLCGHCARRFNDIQGCDFGVSGKYLLKQNATATSNNPPARRRRPPVSPEAAIIVRPTGISTPNPKARTLELRLFYHFTTSTASALPLSETKDVLPLWAVDTPQLAFDHEHLLNAVLGSAAVHMHTLNPTDDSMLQTARHYFVQALHKHRDQVAHINSGNAEASVVASMLLSLLVRLLPRHTQTRSPNETYELPLERFYMTQGMRTLLFASFPHLQGSRVLDCIYAWPPTPSNPDNPSLARRLAGFPMSAKKIPKLPMPPDLKNLTIQDEGPTVDPNIAEITLPLTTCPRDDPNQRTYSVVTAYLLTIYRAVTSDEPRHWIRRRVEAMIVFTPSAEFLALLQAYDPRALGILERYFALMSVVEEGVWWLEGVGGWETRGIAGHMPQGWEWLSKWPLRVVEQGLIPFSDNVAPEGEKVGLFQGNNGPMVLGYEMNNAMMNEPMRVDNVAPDGEETGLFQTNNGRRVSPYGMNNAMINEPMRVDDPSKTFGVMATSG
jgi:hypothetical protein